MSRIDHQSADERATAGGLKRLLWLPVGVTLLALGCVACGDDASEEVVEPVGLAKYINAVLDDPARLPGYATAVQDPASISDMPAVVAGEPDASESDAGETDAGAAADDAGSAPPALKTKDVAPAAAAERSRGKKVTRRKEPTRRKQPSRRKPPSVDKPGKPVLAESAGPAPTGDATDLYYAGVQQLRSGDFNRAVASLSASQRLRSSSRTLAKLGQAYFDSGRLKEAEQTLRAAGRRPEAMLLLATLYQQTSRVDRTRKTYQAFLAHHPDHARAGWVRNMLKQL